MRMYIRNFRVKRNICRPHYINNAFCVAWVAERSQQIPTMAGGRRFESWTCKEEKNSRRIFESCNRQLSFHIFIFFTVQFCLRRHFEKCKSRQTTCSSLHNSQKMVVCLLWSLLSKQQGFLLPTSQLFRKVIFNLHYNFFEQL